MNAKMSFFNRSHKVVISGYYGFDNCGDEAVLLAMIHCLKKLAPNIRIVVLSNNPKKTRDLYSVEAANRWNPLRVAFELIFCRLVLCGGGSLLQDVTSAKSLSYYLAIISFAAFFRKRIMIYSQGIGPLNMEKSRVKVSRALNRCHTITVRDERSAELIGDLGVKHDVHVTCDPVMALCPDDIDSCGLEDDLHGILVSESKDKKRNPLLVAAIRQWSDNRHLAVVAEFLDTQVKRGWDVLLVSAHHPHDMEAVDKVFQLMTERTYRLDSNLTARSFLALTARADRVFSMRLHGLICAFSAGTPLIGLSYDPKVDAFMAQAGLSSYCLPYDTFNSKAAERLSEELDNPLPQSRQDEDVLRREMRQMAWDTAKKAAALIITG